MFHAIERLSALGVVLWTRVWITLNNPMSTDINGCRNPHLTHCRRLALDQQAYKEFVGRLLTGIDV